MNELFSKAVKTGEGRSISVTDTSDGNILIFAHIKHLDGTIIKSMAFKEDTLDILMDILNQRKKLKEKS